MALHAVQAELPLDLFDRLQTLRARYSGALQAAQKGEYGRAGALRSLARRLGRLMAAEARKGPEERGGLTMLELSLTVDRYFPELRGWHQYDAMQSHRRRMLATPALKLAPGAGNRAS